MTPNIVPRFTLLHDHQLLVIKTHRACIETVARFSIDDDPVAEGKSWFEPVTLMHGGLKVEVRSTWPGQVVGCVLLRDDGAEIPFTPPPGVMPVG